MNPHLKVINTRNVLAKAPDGDVYTAIKKTQILVDDLEDFIFEETRLMGVVNGLTSLADFKVLNWIKANLDFNNEVITLNKFYKIKIKEFTKLSDSAIVKSINHLTKAKIIIRDISCIKCGMYHVNPTYIWKGDRKTRKEVLKHVIELIQRSGLDDSDKQLLEDIERFEQNK